MVEKKKEKNDERKSYIVLTHSLAVYIYVWLFDLRGKEKRQERCDRMKMRPVPVCFWLFPISVLGLFFFFF